jgi:hypothetical protein
MALVIAGFPVRGPKQKVPLPCQQSPIATKSSSLGRYEVGFCALATVDWLPCDRFRNTGGVVGSAGQLLVGIGPCGATVAPIPRRPLTPLCPGGTGTCVFRGCERCDVRGGWEALFRSATRYEDKDWLGELSTMLVGVGRGL